MFQHRSLTILRIRGVPIRLHWSLAFLVPYLAYAIGAQFHELERAAGLSRHPFLPPWAWGILLAIGLLVSITLHELGHTFVALRKGGKVRSITLMALGGVSDMTELPKQPAAEAFMAVIGPVISLVLGGIFLGLGFLVPHRHADSRFGLIYFGEINLALGAFNLLPAFPMDGGRVLRALLVHFLGFERATRWAANTGKVIAAAVALAGILSNSLLLLFIALFLWFAGTSEARLVEIESALGDMPALALARSPVPTVFGSTSATGAFELLLREHPPALVVEDMGERKGLITDLELRRVPAGRLATLRARDLAEPLVALPVSATARQALRAMLEHRVDAVLLMRDHETAGVVLEPDLVAIAKGGVRGWRWPQRPPLTPTTPRPV